MDKLFWLYQICYNSGRLSWSWFICCFPLNIHQYVWVPSASKSCRPRFHTKPYLKYMVSHKLGSSSWQLGGGSLQVWESSPVSAPETTATSNWGFGNQRVSGQVWSQTAGRRRLAGCDRADICTRHRRHKCSSGLSFHNKLFLAEYIYIIFFFLPRE